MFDASRLMCAVYYGVHFIYQYMQPGVRTNFGSVCLAVSPCSRALRSIFTHRCIVRVICTCALPTLICMVRLGPGAYCLCICSHEASIGAVK
jgi:hypothetical protein